MSAVTEDGIADVIKVRHLRFVEENAILEFTRVSHHHAIAGDHVFAHVAAAADLTIFADPCRTFQHRALLHDGTSADEDMIADEWFAQQLAQYRGLQAELQITDDLFERIPDVILVFEQLRMSRVFEVKKIGWRKHLLRANRRRSAQFSVHPLCRALPTRERLVRCAIHHFFGSFLQALLARALLPASRSRLEGALL